MVRIRLTPEALIEEAGRLRSLKADNDDVVNRIDNLVNGLLGDWRGEAQEAFSNAYQSRRGGLRQFSLDMEDFTRFLIRYAEAMEDADRSFRRKPCPPPASAL